MAALNKLNYSPTNLMAYFVFNICLLLNYRLECFIEYPLNRIEYSVIQNRCRWKFKVRRLYAGCLFTKNCLVHSGFTCLNVMRLRSDCTDNLCQKSWNNWSSFKAVCITSPLSPSKQCWFMQDINAALESIYLKTTLIDASLQFNIVLRGEGVVILRCRPEIYCYHVKCFYWMVFQGLLAEIGTIKRLFAMSVIRNFLFIPNACKYPAKTCSLWRFKMEFSCNWTGNESRQFRKYRGMCLSVSQHTNWRRGLFT